MEPVKINCTPDRLNHGLSGVLIALVGLLLSGCPGQPSSGTGNRGDELLRQVQRAYERADSYADAGELRLEQSIDGQSGTPETLPFSVSYAEPNKLRIDAFGINVVCDGTHLWSAIADDHLAEQVLFLPAPTDMNLKTLFREPLLEKMLGGEISIRLVPLELMFSNQPFKRLFGEDLTTKWLGEKPLRADETLCHVVEVTGSRGTFVLWVDPKSFVVRRLEITDPKFLNLGLRAGDKMLLTIDFQGAKLNGEIGSNAFKFEPPTGSRLVNHFVLPPQALDYPPNELLGQKPDSFKFVDGGGNPVDLKSLEGRVAVFDMWALSCHWCFESFPNLEKVYKQYKSNDKVTILTVNNDPSDVPDDELQKAFTKAGLDLPIARDPERFSESVFKVTGWPSMVVLGPDGTVQAYDKGYDPHLAETLPGKIDQLLAGKNLAEEALAGYRRLQTDFERSLAEATVDVSQEIELPRAKIAEASQPNRLKIEKIWTAESVKKPGNFIVLADDAGGQRIAVLDNWRAVCEIDSTGKLLARHALDLPEKEAVTQLRTGVDQQGRHAYAVFGALQHKVYLLDDQWQITARYPEETRQGISDVQLADLDGDGQLEAIVGYMGEVGVQCVSLTGQRVWTYRGFENVLSLATLPRDSDGHQRALVANERQAVGVLDYAGTQLADIHVLPPRPIDIIVVANLAAPADNDAGDGSARQAAWKLAALSASKAAELVAVGLDMHGNELWSYAIPTGVRGTPCDILLGGRLSSDGPGQWLLTGPDGSIHILTANGEPFDSFNFGEELTGIGTMVVDGQGILLVATAKELTAWKVTDGEAPTPTADEPELKTADASQRSPSAGGPELSADDAPDSDSDSATSSDDPESETEE
jgi:thiol-disulfide isomerase/thioredoxin/outer membrane lipoprotein-sorting protein